MGDEMRVPSEGQCHTPGNNQMGLSQPGAVEDLPAYCKGIGLNDLQKVFQSNSMIL